MAVLAVGGLQLTLPHHLTVAPGWLLLVVVTALAIPNIVAHRRGHHIANMVLGFTMLSLVTAAVLASLCLLIANLKSKQETPLEMLVAAGGLWMSNVLIFASWYWRLDAGGPHLRDLRGAHHRGAFLFPPMAISPDQRNALGLKHWRPGFVDYLFLAFNTSTAFSPTDVPVLSRWAKLLMMVQAVISLAAVVLLAARAINVL